MLLIYMGSATARSDSEQISSDYRALGGRVKGSGAQIIFSSIFPVEGKGPGRGTRILEMNDLLRRWG